MPHCRRVIPPTLSDPQYYCCLQVILHNCLCQSLPLSLSVSVLFFSPSVSVLHVVLTSICHIVSVLIFPFVLSDFSAVLFLFCLLPLCVTFLSCTSTFSVSHRTTIKGSGLMSNQDFYRTSIQLIILVFELFSTISALYLYFVWELSVFSVKTIN